MDSVLRSTVPAVMAAAFVAGCGHQAEPAPEALFLVADAGARCSDLAGQLIDAGFGGRIESAQFRPAGETLPTPPGFPPSGASPALPEHCEILGILDERVGAGGQAYAIRFRMRLPTGWNRRFYFQGGGGTNGEIGDALGFRGVGLPSALADGYAVISQDSGHSNALNNDPATGGIMTFGFDAEARRNYGHASLKTSYDAAMGVMARYYGDEPERSYFVGCSKGGQEGMAFAQRYPEAFDGIVAGAPGFSLPRAAVAQAWDAGAFASAVRPDGGSVSPVQLAESFSEGDLLLAREAVLEACDADDGLADGLVGAFAQCTDDKVAPRLHARACVGGKQSDCLSDAQIAALRQSYAGPRDSEGRELYVSFPWDAGMADAGWRTWKTGVPGGPPALSVVLGGPALATVFSTPPAAAPADLQELLDLQVDYDFDRDAPAIYATADGFPRSGWEDNSARSPDLDGFRARGGRMIVPHGVSDPVFSITDTIAWWEEVDARYEGAASQFVRVFAAPGMGHCAGGPATDRFDAFAALVDWVERDLAPESILAEAGPSAPWPGRTRPLCPYPLIAQPVDGGASETERAESFVCAAP